MTLTQKRKLHRIRKGWDCPHCRMHFGWEKQFIAHTQGLCPKAMQIFNMKHAMTDTITEINRTLSRCKCGSRVVMRYDPGCTYIHCLAEGVTVAAVPDWQPEALAAEWNQKHSH